MRENDNTISHTNLQAMTFLPFERLTLRSELRSDEVYSRLAAAVEPVRWITNPFSRDHKPSEGEITSSGFKITRMIRYRNSFRPIVTGRIRDEGAGCVIEIILRLNVIVAVFMALWLAVVTGGAIRTLAEVSQGRSAVPALILFGMSAFGYGLMQGAFVFESRKARQFLNALAR